jgi:hypothetical protein
MAGPAAIAARERLCQAINLIVMFSLRKCEELCLEFD